MIEMFWAKNKICGISKGDDVTRKGRTFMIPDTNSSLGISNKGQKRNINFKNYS